MAEQNFHALIPYAINSSIVVALLFFMARKPARKFLYQRHERMKDSFESAAIAHKKAKDRCAAATNAIQGVSAKEAELVARERGFAEQEAREIIEKSHSEAARMLREAERLAGVEQDEASERVKAEFLDMVIREAEGSLRTGLKKEDHSAIVSRARDSIGVGV